MIEPAAFFSDFPDTTKEEWLDKIRKDLKGKSWEDLQWSLEEGLTIPPFYHPDDTLDRNFRPIYDGRVSNDWKIGEFIAVEDSRAANKNVMAALEGGVEALYFELVDNWSPEELTFLLNRVQAHMIGLNFGGAYVQQEPLTIINAVAEHLNGQENRGTYTGAIGYTPTSEIGYLKEVMSHCSAALPRFRSLEIDMRPFHEGLERITRELSLAIGRGGGVLRSLLLTDYPIERASQQLYFRLSVGTSYFVAVAKIRALKLLWANVLKAYGLAPARPYIVAELAQEDDSEEAVNTNRIRTATQAMSATIAGVDELYTYAGSGEETKGPRIARNVQHLLKMESHLHRVVDPAAGSYYIELLTEKLARKAWVAFSKNRSN